MRYLLRAAILLGLAFLPVVFVSQTNDRQVAFMKDINSLMDDGKYPEALAMLQPALDEASAKSNWKPFCDITIAISKCHLYQEHYDSAVYFLEDKIQFLTKSGQGERPEMGPILNNLAVNYANLDLYIPAFNAYQRAIKVFEKNGAQGIQLAYAYKNVAQIYERWNNSSLSIQYFDASLKIDTGHYFQAEVYSQIANHYHFRGDEAAVLHNYELGIAVAEGDEEQIAHLQAAGASAFVAVGKYDVACQMLQKALLFYKKHRADWEDNILICLTELANIKKKQNQPQQALQFLQDGEREAQHYFSAKSRELAKLYIETGRFYENYQQPDRALAYYQKALVQAFPQFNSLNINDNPAVQEAWLESQAMQAAGAKARLLVKMAAQDQHAAATLRQNAAHCFDLAFAVAARLRHTYGNDADKIALSADNRKAYQSAALNLWQLWQDSRDNRYIERLFSLIEQTKAQALADALQHQRALALSGIPDSLLRQEATLRLDAAALAKNYDEQELGKDTATDASLKLKAFRQKKAYDDFIAELSAQYPQFREYAQADASAELPLVQQALPDTAALLSWFDAGDRYLCVNVRKNAVNAVEVPRDSTFDRDLSAFIRLLSDLNAQQSAPADFFRQSFALSQKLLPDNGLSTAKSWVIVPDGLLCYLPFEVLLTAAHEQGGYGTAPYLVLDHAISYAWSAKLLAIAPAASVQGGLAQFASFCKTTRDALDLLSNSLADVPDNLSRTVIEDKEATRDRFLAEAPRNNILHLSTHARAGQNGAPGIEFFDGALPLTEIYGQRLHASLVTLSACETGAGALANGEGVLSLARAFAYAGAQSLVASLWSVNDRATAGLFTAFYQNLQNGVGKAEALRGAKRAFLASAEGDARKAPFFWAAFTLSGSDGAVEVSSAWTGLWRWGLAALVLSLVIFWGFRRRK